MEMKATIIARDNVPVGISEDMPKKSTEHCEAIVDIPVKH